MENRKLPIGYYLKKVDNLLTDGISKIHAEFGITRTDWQILNTIHDKKNTDRNTIYELLSEFATIEHINLLISSLIKNELVFENETLKLTEKGNDIFQTCLQNQIEFRQKSMQSVTEQEYVQLIGILEKIIDNLK